MSLLECKNLINFPTDPEADLTLSSGKKKKTRPRFGLVLKLDSILKKQTSDRVLRQHLACNKSTNFGKVSGPQNRKGRIVTVQQINQVKVVRTFNMFI